jgi:PTH1 family peptidyl-tRNA hydrolase
MKMVVGLGNPGRTYEHTRHNVGFEVVDAMAADAGVVFRKSWRFPAELAEMTCEGEAVLLVKPVTYMNGSGEATGPLMRKKGIAPKDVVVVLDDAELDVGVLRIRKKGSAGKHNGLESVLSVAGTDEIVRVRVGVGKVPAGESRVNFVLGKFLPGEREPMKRSVLRAAEATRSLLKHGVDAAMNEFNGASGGGSNQ